ncbi:hypothetical protein D1007_11007 [Hordeum vulgare]|uniref:Predicted protein n=1 Tax=Hordeum vulgare subsp. vulgare TaxID=112509 RepID=F2CZC5_HORVV|nr:hypothetical protein D1007_11007 [Hordeum vulgare]BAJ88196.1 predicted protein [Hordeum vulgare subsp. vulgare]
MVQAIAGGSVLTWASPEKRLIAGGSVLTWASPEKILIAGGSVLTWASPEKRLLLVFMRKRGCDYKMKGNLHMLARDVGNRRTTHTGQARDQVMYGLEVSSNKQYFPFLLLSFCFLYLNL